MTTVDRVAPTLRQTPAGWLAVAPSEGPQIAVIGATEDEAVANFYKESDSFMALRALAATTPYAGCLRRHRVATA